jgi:hypothetical protein
MKQQHAEYSSIDLSPSPTPTACVSGRGPRRTHTQVPSRGPRGPGPSRPAAAIIEATQSNQGCVW